jgi:hypothetical protein
MSVTLDAGLWARATRNARAGVIVHALATVPLKASLLEGETDPRQGWISSHYGDHQPAPLLLYSTVARLPVRIITLLIPTDDPLGPLPTVSALLENGALVGALLDGSREIRFTEMS